MDRDRFDRLARRVTTLVTCAALVGAAGLAGSDASAGSKGKTFDLESLAKIARAEGYGSVEVHAEFVSFRAEGYRYALYRYDDGDLQTYFGIADVAVTAEDLNVWNRDYRMSRAYIDDEGDPVLEADLLGSAGGSRPVVADFLRVFVESSRQFRAFLAEQERTNEAVRPDPPAEDAPQTAEVREGR